MSMGSNEIKRVYLIRVYNTLCDTISTTACSGPRSAKRTMYNEAWKLLDRWADAPVSWYGIHVSSHGDGAMNGIKLTVATFTIVCDILDVVTMDAIKKWTAKDYEEWDAFVDGE